LVLNANKLNNFIGQIGATKWAPCAPFTNRKKIAVFWIPSECKNCFATQHFYFYLACTVAKGFNLQEDR